MPINKKTGKRERKIFYQIVLKKIDDLEYTDVKSYEFASEEDAKIIKDEEIKNELKISDNVLDFYK